MATIKFTIKENTTVGTHSFYAQAVSYSTLDISDLASEVAENIGISPSTVKMVLERYAVVAERSIMRGHRVKLGDFLTFYPQISASVKDELDKEGNVVKKATADMLNISGCKSTIGATVSQAVQQQFAAGVSWKRIGENDNVAKDDGTTGGTPGGSSDSGKTPSGTGDDSGGSSQGND
ncbi:MAG: HU family DNA-binding protein [Prevotella sp.]